MKRRRDEIESGLDDAQHLMQCLADSLSEERTKVLRDSARRWMSANGLALQSSPRPCDSSCAAKTCGHKNLCECPRPVVHAFGDVFVCRTHSREHICDGNATTHPVVEQAGGYSVCLFSGKVIGRETPSAGPKEGVYNAKRNKIIQNHKDAPAYSTDETNVGRITTKRPRRRRESTRRVDDSEIYNVAENTLHQLFDAGARRKHLEETQQKALEDAQNHDRSYLKTRKGNNLMAIRQDREIIVITAFEKRRRQQVVPAPTEFVKAILLVIRRAWLNLVVGNTSLEATDGGKSLQASKLIFVFGVLNYMATENGLPYFGHHIIRHEPELKKYMPESDDVTKMKFKPSCQSRGWNLLQNAAETKIDLIAAKILETTNMRGMNMKQAQKQASATLAKQIYEGLDEIVHIKPV